MKVRLTDLAIKKLPFPTAGQEKYWDSTTQGFGVRVGKTAKTFFVMFGKARTMRTLGRYPDKSLADARKEAKRHLARNHGEYTSQSYSDARETYLEEAETRLRPNTLRFYKHFLNAFEFSGNVRDIKRSHLADYLQDSHAVIAFKVFFNWCIKCDFMDRNPIAGEKVTYNRSERVLSDEELCAVWNYEVGTFSNIVKLLILTGQRRNEIASLHSDWITNGLITIPASLSKNKKKHTFPYGELAKPYLQGDGLLFGNNRGTSFSGFSKSKALLDAEVKIPHWTLHDLRRTYSTIHARIGTPIHITEALLNHVSGSRAGIVGVYQRYDYAKEMKEAVDNYEQFLSGLLCLRSNNNSQI